MDFSDVVLALVGMVSTISAWVVANVVGDIKKLEDKMTSCQTSMPKEYVLKADHNREMHEIKKMLGNIYDILREKGEK